MLAAEKKTQFMVQLEIFLPFLFCDSFIIHLGFWILDWFLHCSAMKEGNLNLKFL